MQRPEFVREYVVDAARALKMCIMLLNPACIVIGGGIAKAGDALFTPLRSELANQMPAWSGARTDLRPALLGDNSVLYGALGLARGSGRIL
jgi:glucokinase